MCNTVTFTIIDRSRRHCSVEHKPFKIKSSEIIGTGGGGDLEPERSSG